MNATVKLAQIAMLLLSLNVDQNPPINYPPASMESKRVQEFRALSGRDQVHMLLHGTSIFRKIFTNDFWFEEEILVGSRDSTINSPLAAEARYEARGTAREAIFILCERARFVRSHEFPVHVSLDGYVTGIEGGLISPFLPDLDKVGKEGTEAVREALDSSNAHLRTTANIYCGGLERQLASMPVDQLAAKWRAALGKLPNPIFADSDSSETGEFVRVLKHALAERGLESATAISLLLDKETRPWARESEIEMIDFLDGSAVRLRGSQQGKDVIQIVKRTLANKQLKLYRTRKAREGYWKSLQDTFFKDDYTSGGTARDHWATLIGLAFDQYYGEHVLVSEGGHRPSFTRANEFVTYLTKIDPTFPSWEFASTLSEEDMFHPRFAAKMARYHAIWLQMNATHAR
jgi:hypothetical protein